MFQVTSNLAVDKFLNIIALGYSNGMIKIMKYTNDEIATNPDQQWEIDIPEAHVCEVV